MRYSDQFKTRAVNRMTGRDALSPEVLADELDIPPTLLWSWLRERLGSPPSPHTRNLSRRVRGRE